MVAVVVVVVDVVVDASLLQASLLNNKSSFQQMPNKTLASIHVQYHQQRMHKKNLDQFVHSNYTTDECPWAEDAGQGFFFVRFEDYHSLLLRKNYLLIFWQAAA